MHIKYCIRLSLQPYKKNYQKYAFTKYHYNNVNATLDNRDQKTHFILHKKKLDINKLV